MQAVNGDQEDPRGFAGMSDAKEWLAANYGGDLEDLIADYTACCEDLRAIVAERDKLRSRLAEAQMKAADNLKLAEHLCAERDQARALAIEECAKHVENMITTPGTRFGRGLTTWANVTAAHIRALLPGAERHVEEQT
jgi:hypothetical protein